MPAEGTMPRIGYVLKMYPRFSETFVVNEVLALEDQGAVLDIFSLRPPVDGRFHDSVSRVRSIVTYVPVPGKLTDVWESLRLGRERHASRFDAGIGELLRAPASDACQAVALASLVEERGIAHLHAHFGSVAASVARLTARLAGITYSMTLHAKDIFHVDVDHAELAARLDDAAAAITVSEFNSSYLRQRYGHAARRVVRIYNGIDLEAFAPSSPAVRPRVVVGVGRLVEKKGFRHLVDAVAMLRRSERPVHLDLVGTGPEEEPLRQQVAALGLEDRVTFHGPLTQAETRDIIRGAAVLAAPCVVGSDGNRDGLPTVILESLALGTPVVATPVTGIPEAVIHGRTGLLVPEGDARALAGAIETVMDDADLRCRLSVAGRRHVEASFDIRHNARRLYSTLGALACAPQEVGT